MDTERAKSESAENGLPANPRSSPAKLLTFSWWGKLLAKLAFSLLILLTVYVTGGRLVMGMLTYQADAVAAQLSQTFKMPMSIAALDGSWSGFSPILEVQGLRFTAEQTAEPHTHSLARAMIILDPFQSILQRKAVVTRISVSGLALAFQQNTGGNWTLAGLAGGQPDAARRLQNFILDTKSLVLADSTVSIQALNATAITLDGLALTLANTGQTHQLDVQVQLDGQASPSHLSVSMDGAPGNVFSAAAYADVASLDLLPVLKQYLPGSWSWETVNTSARLWATLDESGLQTVQGQLADVQVEAKEVSGNHEIALQNAAAAFALERTLLQGANADGWSVALQDIRFDWQQTPWAVPAIQLQLPADAAGAFTLQAGELDLAMLAQLANSALPLPAPAASALRTLRPRGLMQNLSITGALDGSYPGGFLLRSNLQDGAVDAWLGAPAGSGIDGYVQADNTSGFVELDSDDFTLHLPRLFAQA